MSFEQRDSDKDFNDQIKEKRQGEIDIIFDDVLSFEFVGPYFCDQILIFRPRCSILIIWRRISLSATVCLNLFVVVVMKLVSLHILSLICFSRVAHDTLNEYQDLVVVFIQNTFPASPQLHSVSFLASSFSSSQCCYWNFLLRVLANDVMRSVKRIDPRSGAFTDSNE